MVQKISREFQKYNRLQEKQRNRFEALLCFILALLPKLYLSLSALPVRTISDEVATMAASAYYAGFDWSMVVQNAGYYGTGFFGLFFWVYKLIENPLIIYRTILVFCALMQALVAVISYYFMRNVFQIKSSLFICTSSLVCSFCVVTRTTIAYNEHPLILLCWMYALMLALVLKNKDKQKQRFLYFLIGSFLMAYGLTIHIRFSVVAIATVLVWVLYYLLFREKIFPLKWIGIPVLLCIGAELYISYIQKAIWLVGKGESIRNSEIKVSTAANFRLMDTWKAWVNIIIGQLTTMNVAMLGLFFFSVTMGCLLIIEIILKKHKAERESIPCNQRILLVIFSVFLLSAGGTIFAQSITWLNGVANGFINNETAEIWYSYKAFTYVRYSAPYIGPVVLCGLALSKERVAKTALGIKCSTFVFLIFSLYWYEFVLPFVQNNRDAVEVFIPWSLGWKYGDAVTPYNYVLSFILCFILCLSGWILFQKRKGIYFECILCILLIVQFLTIGKNRDMIIQDMNYKYISNAIPTVERVLSENPDISDIYVYDISDSTDHQIYYLWQFYLYNYKIIPELPARLDGDKVVIANGSLEEFFEEEILERNIYEIKMSDNSYMYLDREVYKATFEDKEFLLSPLEDEWTLKDGMFYKINMVNMQNSGHYELNIKLKCSEDLGDKNVLLSAKTNDNNVLTKAYMKDYEWMGGENEIPLAIDIGFHNENVYLELSGEEIFDAEVESVSVIYRGDNYLEGKDSFAELEDVYEVLTDLGAKDVVLVGYDVEMAGEDILNQIFEGITVRKRNYADLLADNSLEDFLIIKAEKDLTSYQELWNEYVLLSLNDKYYVAVVKERSDLIENWKAKGNSILSDAKGISAKCLDYMENISGNIRELRNLPAKDYNCILEASFSELESEGTITIFYPNGDKKEVYPDDFENGKYEFIVANGLGAEKNIRIESSKEVSIKDIWLKESEHGEVVETLYKTILDRNPDQTGYRDWQRWLSSGEIGSVDLCRNLLLSEEFQTRNISDKNFVKLLYVVCWGMEKTDEHYDSYMKDLENGINRLELIELFLQSDNCILK